MSYFDESLETMPREALQAVQLEKLQELLDVVCSRNRFYRAKFEAAGVDSSTITSVADLRALPFTTKDELLQAQSTAYPLGANATYPETEYTRIHQTSGTTGTPLRVLDTEASWNWWGRCWGFVLAGAGLTAADRLFVPFSFGPFIGFWAAVEGARAIGALMVPGGGRDSLQRVHLIGELDLTAICCTPTYALRLAEVAHEAGVDLAASSVRATIHAGEPGANIPATKARIEAAWGARCFDHAGASEVGAHSFECAQQPGGTHLIETEFIAEVINPETGEALPDGETGELVLTNLGRPGFPVIRYRTGDLVKRNSAPCDCGRTFVRFDGGVLGRADDMVVVRGVNVFPSALENLLRTVDGVVEYQVTIAHEREMRTLAIELELAPDAAKDATVAAVEQRIQDSLGLRPDLRLAPTGSLPRFELKARRFHVLDRE